MKKILASGTFLQHIISIFRNFQLQYSYRAHSYRKKKREKSSLPALKCQSCLKIDTYKVLQTVISPSYDIITAQFGLRSQRYLNGSANQLKDAAIQWRAFKLNKYCMTFTFPFTIPLMLMFVCIQSRNLTFYSYHSDNQNCHSRDKYFRSSPTRGGEITGGFWYSHLNMGVKISTFSSLPRSVTTSLLFALPVTLSSQSLLPF